MKTKIAVSILLTFIVSVLSISPLLAANARARTISIFKIEGRSAKMTKGTPKEFTAKTKMKLFDGYTVSTGKDSFVWLKLDEDSLVKTDQMSKVSVSKASANKLSLSVLSGAILVDAAPQQDGETLEVRAGNTALAVRGTSFVFKSENGGTFIVMLSGSGYVDGVLLEAGRTMTIYDSDTDEERVYQLNDLLDEEIKDLFVLEMILEHGEQLIEDGTLTQDELDKISGLADEIREEQAPKQDTNSSSGSRYIPPTSNVAVCSGKNYTTLKAALEAANASVGQEVTLISDHSISDNITVGGATLLQINSGVTLTNSGSLIVDGSLYVSGQGALINNGTITNNGSLSFGSGSVYGGNVSFDSSSGGNISFAADMTFDGGAVLGASSFFDSSDAVIGDLNDLRGNTYAWDNSKGGWKQSP